MENKAEMKILDPKTWPLFRPIPKEHVDHVKGIMLDELFWNVRVAIIGLILATVLYYYLLSQEVNLLVYKNWIAIQSLIYAIIVVFYYFGKSWIRSLRIQSLVASSQAFMIAAALGFGYLVQFPAIHDAYRIASVFSLVVGVSGAAAFTFTVSPVTFLLFSLPFIGPITSWLWFSSPNATGQVLAVMTIPYYAVLFFTSLREYRRRVNLILTELNLKREQERSQTLLLNILPHEIAEELKTHGRAAANEYDRVTVLFTDFVGFTRIAEKLTPRELIDELDRCFSYFDQVTEKYGLEKLKTIGDSFMCAGGLPKENKTHPIDCALAALEIQSFMTQMKEIKHQQGFDYWELRLGIHTGPLVAGVVGHRKFAYDVWGDTVNIASRMESSGAAGAINISRQLYEQLRFLFVCEFRGTIHAKNKGEIEMYFLRGIRAKFSLNNEGRVPNDQFKEIYERIANGARLMPRRSEKITLST